MQSGSRDPLADHETLAVPLRSPQDYRVRADRLLAWLSRRWLYNIPKSLQTDGLCPLGRLALVDHAGGGWPSLLTMQLGKKTWPPPGARQG